MNYLLFANPVTGSPILTALIKKGIKPSVVVTTSSHIDSWKRIAYRIVRNQMTVEDKLRFIYKIPFYDYRMINSDRLKKIIGKHNIEIGIITTFSYLISEDIYDCFERGVFNFHPSRLPLHGGANPIYWILKNKDEYTGTTCYQINENLDNGDIFMQSKYQVNESNEKILFKMYTDDICNMLPELLSDFDALKLKKRKMPETIFDPKKSG